MFFPPILSRNIKSIIKFVKDRYGIRSYFCLNVQRTIKQGQSDTLVVVTLGDFRTTLVYCSGTHRDTSLSSFKLMYFLNINTTGSEISGNDDCDGNSVQVGSKTILKTPSTRRLGLGRFRRE